MQGRSTTFGKTPKSLPKLMGAALAKAALITGACFVFSIAGGGAASAANLMDTLRGTWTGTACGKPASITFGDGTMTIGGGTYQDWSRQWNFRGVAVASFHHAEGANYTLPVYYPMGGPNHVQLGHPNGQYDLSMGLDYNPATGQLTGGLSDHTNSPVSWIPSVSRDCEHIALRKAR